MRRTPFILVVCFVLRPGLSAAQDTPRFGMVMGYPAQVGVVWTIADRLAIRPELNWTHSTTETTSIATIFNGTGVTTNTVTNTTESNTIGTGVSALIYVSTRENLRTYVSPRFAYSRLTTSVNPSASLGGVPVSISPTTSNYTVSGSLGAQYNAAKHFGIFGEVGLSYGRSALSVGLSLVGDNKSRTTGLRSGAGVILFLGS